MWYEILPSLTLVMGIMCVPQGFAWCWHRFRMNWSNEIKNWEYDWWGANRDYFHYLRDQRITGSPFVMRGLEAQPTPDDTEKINPEDLLTKGKGGFLKNPLMYTVRER